MKKLFTLLFLGVAGWMQAQTIIFQDNFESYDQGTNLSNAGYTIWEGTASAVDVTQAPGTEAYEGQKYGKSDDSSSAFIPVFILQIL